MSNYSPSLQEFICPIPICQSEADLGNMLDIFQHLNCQNLAIPDGIGGWGIVYAKDLLSLVTEAWLGERIASIGHPRNAMSHQNIDYKTIPRVKIPLESATIYRPTLKLTEFLASLQYDPLFWEREVCLIVDRQGELLGQLDRNNIIAYLASSSSSKSTEVPFSLTYLAGLIDEIALPCKIETAWGQTISANQQWRILEQENSQVLSQTSKTNSGDLDLDRMTKKWIASQKAISFGDRHCPQDFNSPKKPQQKAKNSTGEERNPSEFEIKQESNWNYLKIPLKNPEGETVRGSYYWILATPAMETTKSVSNNSVSTLDKSTTQILGAVSHELKSPLTGIVGLSSLLKGQQLGLLNQRQIRYVELIHRSGKKMMRIIDDLLQLTALIAEPSSETELINLEFLCRQLYQKISTKVELSNADSDRTIAFTQPSLKIEFGSEITIANESLLSSILSHLMLEALTDLPNSEQLEIQISSGRGGTTVITIIRHHDTSLANEVGLNLTLAEHLATAMRATLTDRIVGNRRQLTLQLPKKEIKSLRPVSALDSHSPAAGDTEVRNLTILCLYPELEVIDSLANDYDSNFDLKSFNDSCGLPAGCQHRLIEADSIEQAHNLARIWRIDAIILNDCQIAEPALYLRSLQEYEHLASLPLITLDTKTTEAANQIEGLNVFPCLIPSQCRSIEDLIQVIQIAIES